MGAKKIWRFDKKNNLVKTAEAIKADSDITIDRLEREKSKAWAI